MKGMRASAMEKAGAKVSYGEKTKYKGLEVGRVAGALVNRRPEY